MGLVLQWETHDLIAVRSNVGKLLAHLEDAGLAETEREKHLAYIEKLGPTLVEEIRKDRRPRPDGSGGETTRASASWGEAHQILVELEGIIGTTKALASFRNGGQYNHQRDGGNDDWYDNQQAWQSDSKGKSKGKGKR